MRQKDVILVQGGTKINGSVDIHGSKNSLVALISASILLDDYVILNNVPDISDIKYTISILMKLGMEVSLLSNEKSVSYIGGNRVKMKTKINNFDLHEDVSKLRASSVLMGSILSKYGRIRTYLPGGCKIGLRPINFHLEAFAKMGAKIDIENGYISAKVDTKSGKLNGSIIEFPWNSVGATQNVINAAVFANGTTLIKNPSFDPDVMNMIDFLKRAGAKINITKDLQIEIEGVDSLSKSIEYNTPCDRLVLGTYVMLAAATRGKILFNNIKKSDFDPKCHSYIEAAGINISFNSEGKLFVDGENSNLRPFDIETSPFPGFITDLQPAATVLACTIKGESTITENIFENRFMHVPELLRMGAKINIMNNKLIINGVEKLKSAKLNCTDLRASTALIMAGIFAEGTSEIYETHHLDRGYSNFIEQLNLCGAKIERKFIFD